MGWGFKRTFLLSLGGASSSIRNRRGGQRLAEDHDDGAGSDEQAAGDNGHGQLFTQQQPGKDHDERHAEFVERRHARGWAKLQGAKVAEPGEPRGQTGEGEEKDGPAVEKANLAVFAEADGDGPGKGKDYRGADCGGEV